MVNFLRNKSTLWGRVQARISRPSTQNPFLDQAISTSRHRLPQERITKCHWRLVRTSRRSIQSLCLVAPISSSRPLLRLERIIRPLLRLERIIRHRLPQERITKCHWRLVRTSRRSMGQVSSEQEISNCRPH